MRAHWKPLLTLILIAPLLTELLSNNLPPAVFFSSRAILFLLTVGYGFPLLLLREFACRHRMGVFGLCCLGLVYGIINEGILAKTFYLATGIPLPVFDHYGYVAGVAVPWALTISAWHARHALLYPLLIVYFFFPKHREEPWLTRKMAVALTVLTSFCSMLIFFSRSEKRAPGDLPHFVLMLLCMGGLAWIAVKASASARLEAGVSFRRKSLGWGAVSYFGLLLCPVLLIGAKISPVIFCTYFAVVLVLFLGWLARQRTLSIVHCLNFAVGDEITFLFFGLVEAVHHASVQKLAVDCFFLTGFVLLLARIRSHGTVEGKSGCP